MLKRWRMLKEPIGKSSGGLDEIRFLAVGVHLSQIPRSF